MFSRPKLPRTVPLETPDNSSDSSDSENEEGKEIQVNMFVILFFFVDIWGGGGTNLLIFLIWSSVTKSWPVGLSQESFNISIFKKCIFVS